MGSHNSFYIDANVAGSGMAIDTEIKKYVASHALDHAWRKWSEQSKWWPIEEVVILSKSFPIVIFSLQCNGEDGPFKYFYLDGVLVPEYWALPKRWPSKSAMISGKKKMDAYNKAWAIKEKKLEAEQHEKNRLAKIAELENQLKQLKTG